MTAQPAMASLDLALRHRLRPAEVLPWLLIIACFFVFPDYKALGAQVLIMILFALSLDLILGFAGIVTLGHAAFFGTGAYTVGLLAHAGWSEPLSALVVAAAAAALVGVVSGWIVLRTHGLTLLMLTLATTVMLEQIANEADTVTGGSDGLLFDPAPLLGRFDFDLFGQTAYIYAGLVLFLMFVLARRVVYAPFGRALIGIRENVARMHAVGAPVRRTLIIIYTISAAMAGVAGALLAQTSQIVALNTLSFERSGTVLIMLVLGGTGRLYGAFLGAAVYMVLEDRLSVWDPLTLAFKALDWLTGSRLMAWYSANHSPEYYWPFWIGLVLVLTVLFARRGLLGLLEDAAAALARRFGAAKERP